jgi:hypothetical protein
MMGQNYIKNDSFYMMVKEFFTTTIQQAVSQHFDRTIFYNKYFYYLRYQAHIQIMAHHFYESRKVETAHFETADKFYRTRLHAVIIKRFDYNTGSGKQKQLADIDVAVTLENGSTITVSEKKRTRDFDDLYLEVFSKFPEVLGWTEGSQADFLAYFFPTRVLWAGFPQIKRFFRESLLPQIPATLFGEMKNNHPGQNAKQKFTVKIAGVSYPVLLIQAYNESDGNRWYTMGISIPFKMLNDNHIRYNIFKME